jgi:hypothetical protein
MKYGVIRVTAVAALALVLACGCQMKEPTVNRAPGSDQSLHFVRPDRYTVLGTRSISEYIEITYERSRINEADMAVVEVGLRNRGGRRWYNKVGPNIAVSIKASFYEDPIEQGGPAGPPVYETNWQAVPIPRGDTAHYSVTCPVAGGKYYQVTISELLK